jgi:hypothetical protein
MKTLNELSSEVRSFVNSQFLFKEESGESFKRFNNWLESEAFTNSGKKRLPAYYVTCLNTVYTQLTELYRDHNCIYCYMVDGVLYTTFKKDNKNKYLFKGDTEIKNYREDQGVERKVLNSEYSESGFYHSNGKPYYTIKNR